MPYHSRVQLVHKRNPTFPGYSFCGLDGSRLFGRLKVTDNWAKVSCGNCRAYVDSLFPLAEQSVGEGRQLYTDSSTVSTTVWECVVEPNGTTQMWPLSIAGERLPIPHKPPTWEELDSWYGPLFPVTELDMLIRFTRRLEGRLYDGGL